MAALFANGSIMRRLLFIGLAVVLVAAALALWFVQDANRFKSALVALIAAETGVSVQIDGDLSWRLAPVPLLAAEDLHAVHQGRAWSLQRLVLRPDVASLIGAPGTLEKWRLSGLELVDLSVEASESGSVLRVARGRLVDFGPDSLASVEAELVYTPARMAPVEVAMQGLVAVSADRMRVRDLSFRNAHAEGSCNLEVMPYGKLWPPLTPKPEDVLPVSIMRSYDWDGRCDVQRFSTANETIGDAHLVLDNKEGGSIVTVSAPSFLGGEGQLEVVIRADLSPVSWELKPVIAGVESGRLASLLGGSSLVGALVDYGGTVRMRGNTVSELAASLQADTRFATGPGELDSSGLAASLARVHALLGGADDATTAVPEMIAYESLTCDWQVDGASHRLQIALDDLQLQARGEYDLAGDALNMRGVITLGELADRWAPKLSPALSGLPLHFLCSGSIGEPDCRLDARRTLLGAARVRGSSRARDLIDEHVPERYQEAARSLVEQLGVSVDEALRKDPHQLIDEHVPEKYRGMARSLLDQLDSAADERN